MSTLTLTNWTESLKMDADWFRVRADELRYHRPVCRYCLKLCRRGSWADHFWPDYDQQSFHDACYDQAQREETR